jgi:hypothetical protein
MSKMITGTGREPSDALQSIALFDRSHHSSAFAFEPNPTICPSLLLFSVPPFSL